MYDGIPLVPVLSKALQLTFVQRAQHKPLDAGSRNVTNEQDHAFQKKIKTRHLILQSHEDRRPVNGKINST